MSNNQLKAHIGRVAEVMGYEIGKSRHARTAGLLQSLGIDLLIDVGANRGQYARSRRAGGYKGEIVSFEPLSSAHAELLILSADDPNWRIAERMAVGDTTGDAEINIARNSASSSILPVLDASLVAEPESAYIGKETAPLRRLDDVLAAQLVGRRVFLKLDVQGFEKMVLRGAERTLAASLGVQLEMSLIPMYEGEMIMPEMLPLLLAKGLSLWDLQPGYRNSITGRLLQVDGIFTRQLPS